MFQPWCKGSRISGAPDFPRSEEGFDTGLKMKTDTGFEGLPPIFFEFGKYLGKEIQPEGPEEEIPGFRKE